MGRHAKMILSEHLRTVLSCRKHDLFTTFVLLHELRNVINKPVQDSPAVVLFVVLRNLLPSIVLRVCKFGLEVLIE